MLDMALETLIVHVYAKKVRGVSAVTAQQESHRREEAETTEMANGSQKRRRGGGPKTPEGKRRSSQNSWKHGLTSSNPVGAGESDEEWLSFRDEMIEVHQPADIAELKQVDTIASAEFRMRRGPRYEAAYLDKCHRLHAVPERRMSAEENLLTMKGCDIQAAIDLLAELECRDGFQTLEYTEARDIFWLVCVFTRNRAHLQANDVLRSDAQWTCSDLTQWLGETAAKLGRSTEDLVDSVTAKAREVLTARRMHRTSSEGAGVERLFEPHSPLLNSQRYEIGLQRIAERAYKGSNGSRRRAIKGVTRQVNCEIAKRTQLCVREIAKRTLNGDPGRESGSRVDEFGRSV